MLGSKVAMVLEPPAELPWVGGVSEATKLLPATHTSAQLRRAYALKCPETSSTPANTEGQMVQPRHC